MIAPPQTDFHSSIAPQPRGREKRTIGNPEALDEIGPERPFSILVSSWLWSLRATYEEYFWGGGYDDSHNSFTHWILLLREAEFLPGSYRAACCLSRLSQSCASISPDLWSALLFSVHSAFHSAPVSLWICVARSHKPFTPLLCFPMHPFTFYTSLSRLSCPTCSYLFSKKVRDMSGISCIQYFGGRGWAASLKLVQNIHLVSAFNVRVHSASVSPARGNRTNRATNRFVSRRTRSQFFQLRTWTPHSACTFELRAERRMPRTILLQRAITRCYTMKFE